MMHQPNRDLFKQSIQSNKDWREIFANPSDIKIDTFETGKLTFSNKFMINLFHQNAQNIKEEELTVPVYCHLIQHKVYGDYLVDTGLDRSFQSDIYGNIQGKRREILWPLKSYQNEGQDIATQLSLRKITLKGVFLSHLHIDHVAGIQNLSKDLPIIIGKDEPYHNSGKRFFQDHFKGINTIYEINFTSIKEKKPLGPSVDIFGDGSFWAISTPGHTKGHISYLINSKKQITLLTGDACDLELGFKKCIGPGLGSFNIDLAQKSLEQLISFINLYPQIKVVFGHAKTVH